MHICEIKQWYQYILNITKVQFKTNDEREIAKKKFMTQYFAQDFLVTWMITGQYLRAYELLSFAQNETL